MSFKRVTVIFMFSDLKKTPVLRGSVEFISICMETPEDDIDMRHAGHQMNLGLFPISYSCSATLKIPQVESINFFFFFYKNS